MTNTARTRKTMKHSNDNGAIVSKAVDEDITVRIPNLSTRQLKRIDDMARRCQLLREAGAAEVARLRSTRARVAAIVVGNSGQV